MPWKSNTAPANAPERLTALYHQLQGVMPLLRDIVQPGKVEEGTVRYASLPSPPADAGSRYHFEKRGKESWALLALTKYKKGVEALIERLEAYERYIAHMAVVDAAPQQAHAGERPAVPAPS